MSDHPNPKDGARNKERFLYRHLTGRPAYYTPDFKIGDTYLEVKGYETDLDRCKWRQFPAKLMVWKKEEIDKIKSGGLHELVRDSVANKTPNRLWGFNSLALRQIEEVLRGA